MGFVIGFYLAMVIVVFSLTRLAIIEEERNYWYIGLVSVFWFIALGFVARDIVRGLK